MGDSANLVLSWRSVMMALVCLPIVLSVVLLTIKKTERTACRILALGLFFCVLAITPQIIGFAGFYHVWPGLTFFPFETTLWLGPLIYLHAHVLLLETKLAWRKWLILPGVCQSIYYIWAFLFLGDYKNKWDYTKRIHDPYINPIETILSIVSLATAIFFIWKMYIKYQKFVANTESIATEFEPIWLKRIIGITIATAVLYSLIEGLDLVFHFSYVDAFPFLVFIMLGFAWLSIESVFRLNQTFPKMTSQGTPKNSVDTESTSVNINKNGSGTHDTESIARAEKIEFAVRNNQWYLEPRFSLRDLAERLGTNEVYVSKSINQYLGSTFNDYINQYRVEHAKQLIISGKASLLNIALDSGFNSKATFNRVFKGIAKQTPSQFKGQKGLKS